MNFLLTTWRNILKLFFSNNKGKHTRNNIMYLNFMIIEFYTDTINGRHVFSLKIYSHSNVPKVLFSGYIFSR